MCDVTIMIISINFIYKPLINSDRSGGKGADFFVYKSISTKKMPESKTSDNESISTADISSQASDEENYRVVLLGAAVPY